MWAIILQKWEVMHHDYLDENWMKDSLISLNFGGSILVWRGAVSFKPKVHRLALICSHLRCSLIILENQKTDERPQF